MDWSHRSAGLHRGHKLIDSGPITIHQAKYSIRKFTSLVTTLELFAINFNFVHRYTEHKKSCQFLNNNFPRDEDSRRGFLGCDSM
jgi:hypothetical protein